jgi:zinc transporter ZupT
MRSVVRAFALAVYCFVYGTVQIICTVKILSGASISLTIFGVMLGVFSGAGLYVIGTQFWREAKELHRTYKEHVNAAVPISSDWLRFNRDRVEDEA